MRGSRIVSVCEKCVTDCCAHFNVFLTAADVRRIQQSLRLDPLEFASPLSASALPSGSMYPEFKLSDDRFLLVLDKKLGKQKCVFLLTPGNTRRCGIYAFKPMVCRTYPFTLDSKGRLETVEPFLCPKYWWPEKNEKAQTINDITILRRELEEYRLLVDIWNKQHSQQGDFPKFTAFILARKPKASFEEKPKQDV